MVRFWRDAKFRLEYFKVNAKKSFSAFLQRPQLSLNAMFKFRAINTGIFSILFHNNNNYN